MQRFTVSMMNRARIYLVRKHAPAAIINAISAYVARKWRDER